jgi:Flp pilus assembly protein TadG
MTTLVLVLFKKPICQDRDGIAYPGNCVPNQPWTWKCDVEQLKAMVVTGSGGRRSRSLGSCRRGSVAVEFALACTPLLLIVFGFIATSWLFNTWATMQSNVQYAARMVSTRQVTNNTSGTIAANPSVSTTCGSKTWTTNQAEYYACTGLPTSTTFTVTTTETCSVPSVTISLSASAKGMAVIDIANIFSSGPIVAQAVFMKEGTCP